MTITELEKQLKELGISDDYYAINLHQLPNQMMCLNQIGEQEWEVFYSERGQKTGLVSFDSEDEACAYMLQELVAYAESSRETGTDESIDFEMFCTDPFSDQICIFFNENGVPAYVKGTGLEAAQVDYGLRPVLFVDKNQIEKANELYREWKENVAVEEGMSQEEIESSEAYKRQKKVTTAFQIVVWAFIIIVAIAFLQSIN